MSNDTNGNGKAYGHPVGRELAWWHRDSAGFHVEIAERAYKIASILEAVGPDDCREMRLELRRALKYSRQFDELQFADLDG